MFGAAWNGRKYSIKTAPALRAFIRVAPDVVQRLDQEHADRTDFRAIGRVIAPWGRRIGDLRFETDGAWKRSGRRSISSPRSCGSRCSIRRARSFGSRLVRSESPSAPRTGKSACGRGERAKRVEPPRAGVGPREQ